jgi:hypothetical protein
MGLSAASGAARRSMSYDARLAERVLLGGKNAEHAAMALLERCQPETLEAAVGLLEGHGALTTQAFDRLADAWATFRHIKHLSWD